MSDVSDKSVIDIDCEQLSENDMEDSDILRVTEKIVNIKKITRKMTMMGLLLCEEDISVWLEICRNIQT